MLGCSLYYSGITGIFAVLVGIIFKSITNPLRCRDDINLMVFIQLSNLLNDRWAPNDRLIFKSQFQFK